jgi:hypothetical protein
MSLESLDRAVKGTIDHSVGDIIAKYGDTQSIAMAVQRGEIKNVTNAVMAGMAIDRIAANALKPPTTTVAQDTLPMGQAPQTGVAAAQQMQGQPAVAGLDQIPISEGMFTAANGGIVAFEDGGNPSQRILESLSLPELQEYYRTKKLPRRFEVMADPKVSGMMVDPIFGEAPQGELMAPAAPQQFPIGTTDLRAPVTMRGGLPVPVDAKGTELAPKTDSTTTASVVKKPEGDKKPLSIFDEAKNAADKLNAYKTQFGVGGEDPDVAMRDKLKQLQEGTKEERREAAYMAMIMAGLGIAGGTSPYAAVNLKEAIPALKEYGVAKRDIKKADMEYTKMETEINRAAEARKRGDMELALKLEESAADRDLRLRQVIAAERAASKPSQLGELINLATKGTPEERTLARGALLKTDSKPMSQYERATLRQRAMRDAATELSKNSTYSRLSRSKKPEDQEAAQEMYNATILRYMSAAGGSSNLGGATLLSYGDE